jgi:hypothetical protein
MVTQSVFDGPTRIDLAFEKNIPADVAGYVVVEVCDSFDDDSGGDAAAADRKAGIAAAAVVVGVAADDGGSSGVVAAAVVVAAMDVLAGKSPVWALLVAAADHGFHRTTSSEE